MFNVNQGFSLLSMVFAITLAAILFSISIQKFQAISSSAEEILTIEQELHILRDSQLAELGLTDKLTNDTTRIMEHLKRQPQDSLQGQIVTINGRLFLQIPLETKSESSSTLHTSLRHR